MSFFEILSFGFMQRALVTGVSIALICSSVGLFLVLKRYALFGDALAHSAFGGVAAGLFFGVQPILSAFVISILSALGLSRIRQRFQISGDSIVAILLSSGIAVGVVLISISGGFSVDLFSFLFGSIMLVSLENSLFILGISGSVLVSMIVFYKKFLYVTFDEEQAKVSGISVDRINYLLIVIAGLTVVSSMQLVGVLLVSALFVIPNVTAMLYKRSFKETVILSMSFSVFSTVSGILLSYPLDIAPSGVVVLVSIAVFLVSLIVRAIVYDKRRVLPKTH